MTLTDEIKAKIDSMSHEDMLKHWGEATQEDPLLVGECGVYFTRALNAKRGSDGKPAVIDEKPSA